MDVRDQSIYGIDEMTVNHQSDKINDKEYWVKLLLHDTTRSDEHSEKEVTIKNCGPNGPEGQFMTDSAAMCNAGSPPYCRVFMISRQSTKVSMKKKGKKREGKVWEGSTQYIPIKEARACTVVAWWGTLRGPQSGALA